MGKGLQIKDSGIHVAFCAGTGVLVFLDLASHLLLEAANLSESKFGPDFEFHLYAAFANCKNAIGLNLLIKISEAL